MDILVRNESSDQEESFKHVCAGRVSSVSSPFSKIAKQLPRLRSKMELPIKKCVLGTDVVCVFNLVIKPDQLVCCTATWYWPNNWLLRFLFVKLNMINSADSSRFSSFRPCNVMSTQCSPILENSEGFGVTDFSQANARVAFPIPE